MIDEILKMKLGVDITNLLDVTSPEGEPCNEAVILEGLDENGMPVIRTGDTIHRFERNEANEEFVKSLMQKLGELYDN